MNNDETDMKFMKMAGRASCDNVKYSRGGPFGAVIVNNNTGDVVASCGNSVILSNDPTAHAEVNAIRTACKQLKTHNLEGHTLYSSCEPCPMCLGAIYWAHIDKVFYSNTKNDAANIGFDDSFIYKELEKKNEDRSIEFKCIECAEAVRGFELWKQDIGSAHY